MSRSAPALLVLLALSLVCQPGSAQKLRLPRKLKAMDRQLVQPLGPEDRARLATQALVLLEKWVAQKPAPSVRRTMEVKLKHVTRLLADLRGRSTRRRFLNRVATGLAAAPKVSDLAALSEVVAWEAHLLGALAPGKAQLDALTRDLMALFTERGPDVLSRSGSKFYRAGRFGDSGFKQRLRDGSDQVRHFCAALRLFASSTQHEATEQMLRFKELRDARVRKLPLDQADLRLNHAARLIAEAAWPPPPRKKTGSASRPTPSPLPLRALPQLLLHELGG